MDTNDREKFLADESRKSWPHQAGERILRDAGLEFLSPDWVWSPDWKPNGVALMELLGGPVEKRSAWIDELMRQDEEMLERLESCAKGK